MNVKNVSQVSIIILVLLVLSVASLQAQDDGILTAVAVDSVTMSPADPVWDDVPVLDVPLEQQQEDGTPAMTVALQAAYTDDMIYIRTVWPDDTRNDVRRTWHFDGENWIRGDKIEDNTPFKNEDRLAFAFNITGFRQFDILGCGAACHIDDEPKFFGLDTGSEDRLDVWHWKASRTDPAGYADDQWATEVSFEDPDEVTGRHGDSKESGNYANNINEAGDGPAFMLADMGADAVSYLLAAEAVPFDPEAGWEAGDTVPYYLLAPAIGSRGDIAAASDYVEDAENGNYWVVVLARALDTGNDDDAAFVTSEAYTFGVSVFDNGGGYSHATSEAQELAFE